MAEAGRYAGHGIRITSKRVGRRARLMGTEAAHRTGLAAQALAGRQPEPRSPRLGRVTVVAAVATAGAVAAMAVRQAVVVLRARATGDSTSVSEAAPVGARVNATAAGDGSAGGQQPATTGNLRTGAQAGA